MENQNNNFEKTNIALKFEKLSKNFNNNKILKNLNFEVKKGEFHGFIGSNGAGKTTTFRCLLGFYPDFTGNILINGISNRDVKQSRKFIGYIPEIATFPKKINVIEYLELMARFSNIPEKNAKEIVQK
ncbi:ABC transporter for multidrug [Chlamydia abortus]|jgi:ABC transporter, ATP-binding protein|nr:ABC transporter for multidrug [Chlamydia abortus]SGA32702.1 ABC transporter for multidrug [Chlamydia abortus]